MINQKLVQQDLSRKGRVRFGLRGLEKDGVAYSIKLVHDLQRELNAFNKALSKFVNNAEKFLK